MAVTANLKRMARSAAGVADRLRPPPPGVSVLIYHRVGARTPMRVDLPTAAFDAQMAMLASERRAIGIDAALLLLSGEGAAGIDPVVVSFDDGTTDWADDVLPVLVRHQVPAVFYVATDFVERQLPLPHGGAPISWTGLAELVSTGLATIGSHTHTHLLLDRAPREAVVDELARSKGLIEDRLGVECAHFAYPKAVLGSIAAQAEVRERFASAAIAGNRPNPYRSTDVHRLARTPITNDDDLTWFRRKVDTGLRLEDQLRQLVNRRRYAGAAT